jgi:hypothetical protein
MLNLAAMGAQRRRGRFLVALRAPAGGSARWTASATAGVVPDLLANRSQILSPIDGLRVNSLWEVNNFCGLWGGAPAHRGDQGFGYLRRQKRHLSPRDGGIGASEIGRSPRYHRKPCTGSVALTLINSVETAAAAACPSALGGTGLSGGTHFAALQITASGALSLPAATTREGLTWQARCCAAFAAWQRPA